MKQFIDGSLKTKKSKMYYKNEPVDNYDYQDQPHEIAAREAEEILYKEYMNAWHLNYLCYNEYVNYNYLVNIW